jgi:hypothetical protein
MLEDDGIALKSAAHPEPDKAGIRVGPKKKAPKAKKRTKPKAAKTKPKPKKKTKRPAKSKARVKKRAKAAGKSKKKTNGIMRPERLDMRLTKAQKVKIYAKAKKTRRTITSLVIEAIEKIR